jgi:hypothetical protein
VQILFDGDLATRLGGPFVHRNKRTGAIFELRRVAVSYLPGSALALTPQQQEARQLAQTRVRALSAALHDLARGDTVNLDADDTAGFVEIPGSSTGDSAHYRFRLSSVASTAAAASSAGGRSTFSSAAMTGAGGSRTPSVRSPAATSADDAATGDAASSAAAVPATPPGSAATLAGGSTTDDWVIEALRPISGSAAAGGAGADGDSYGDYDAPVAASSAAASAYLSAAAASALARSMGAALRVRSPSADTLVRREVELDSTERRRAALKEKK